MRTPLIGANPLPCLQLTDEMVYQLLVTRCVSRVVTKNYLLIIVTQNCVVYHVDGIKVTIWALLNLIVPCLYIISFNTLENRRSSARSLRALYMAWDTSWVPLNRSFLLRKWELRKSVDSSSFDGPSNKFCDASETNIKIICSISNNYSNYNCQLIPFSKNTKYPENPILFIALFMATVKRQLSCSDSP